jgi:hypothetical protein
MNKVHGLSWFDVILSVAIIGAVFIVVILSINFENRLGNYKDLAFSNDVQGLVNELFLMSQREPENFTSLLEMAVGRPVSVQASGFGGCGEAVGLENLEMMRKLGERVSSNYTFEVNGERLVLTSCEKKRGSEDLRQVEYNLDLFR